MPKPVTFLRHYANLRVRPKPFVPGEEITLSDAVADRLIAEGAANTTGGAQLLDPDDVVTVGELENPGAPARQVTERVVIDTVETTVGLTLTSPKLTQDLTGGKVLTVADVYDTGPGDGQDRNIVWDGPSFRAVPVDQGATGSSLVLMPPLNPDRYYTFVLDWTSHTDDQYALAPAFYSLDPDGAVSTAWWYWLGSAGDADPAVVGERTQRTLVIGPNINDWNTAVRAGEHGALFLDLHRDIEVHSLTLLEGDQTAILSSSGTGVTAADGVLGLPEQVTVGKVPLRPIQKGLSISKWKRSLSVAKSVGTAPVNMIAPSNKSEWVSNSSSYVGFTPIGVEHRADGEVVLSKPGIYRIHYEVGFSGASGRFMQVRCTLAHDQGAGFISDQRTLAPGGDVVGSFDVTVEDRAVVALYVSWTPPGTTTALNTTYANVSISPILYFGDDLQMSY